MDRRDFIKAIGIATIAAPVVAKEIVSTDGTARFKDLHRVELTGESTGWKTGTLYEFGQKIMGGDGLTYEAVASRYS